LKTEEKFNFPTNPPYFANKIHLLENYSRKEDEEKIKLKRIGFIQYGTYNR